MADLQIPNGLVAVTTHGSVQADTVQALMDTRSFCEKNGLININWRLVPGALVDKARNDACREMLRANAGWLLMIDADMAWEQGAVASMLQTAYGSHPWADVLGAYCSLRGELALPTIDTGTGTWESWYPGSGVVGVIRTGGAFLLVKRHVLERLTDPWFRMRVPARPVDFMAEVDNYARMKFDGRNPLRNLSGEPWEKMERMAQADPSAVAEQFTPMEVGEDSGFCDRVRNAGMRIAVNTDIVIGHLDKHTVDWRTHRAAMDGLARNQRLAVGLLQ